MTENEKLDLILFKMTTLDEKVSSLDEKVSSLDEKVSSLDEKVSSLDEKVSSLESDMQDVKQRVTRVELTLDNEIRVNIQRVAEGHLDLSRNLHDAMKPSNEIEMLGIKVRLLESEVMDLKQKIS